MPRHKAIQPAQQHVAAQIRRHGEAELSRYLLALAVQFFFPFGKGTQRRFRMHQIVRPGGR